MLYCWTTVETAESVGYRLDIVLVLGYIIKRMKNRAPDYGGMDTSSSVAFQPSDGIPLSPLMTKKSHRVAHSNGLLSAQSGRNDQLVTWQKSTEGAKRALTPAIETIQAPRYLGQIRHPAASP